MNKVKPTDYWSTPDHIFSQLNTEHGPVELDVCANATNAKSPEYLTEEQDALTCSWNSKVCWMNPPYSNPEPWIKKATEEAALGAKVIAFLKADHTTEAYKKYIFDYETLTARPGVTIIPWPKRVKFKAPPGLLNKKGKPVKSCTATFPNIVVIFQQPK